MRIWHVAGLVAVWTLVAALSFAEAQPSKALTPKQAAAVDQAVEKQLADQGIVGAAIGVIRGGEIVYVKGYGLADREARTPVTA
jgi:CubicO group peptidase (beta-lactamase class C family)